MNCKYNKETECDAMRCELEFCSRLFKKGGKYFHLTGLDKTSRKITRITVDIDTKDINDMLKCLKTLKKHKFVKGLIIKPSATDKGFHVIAWSNKGVTKKKLLKIRRKAGDDHIRCMLDRKSNRMIQVLFTTKKKSKSNLVVDNIKMEYVVKGEEENVKICVGEI